MDEPFNKITMEGNISEAMNAVAKCNKLWKIDLETGLPIIPDPVKKVALLMEEVGEMVTALRKNNQCTHLPQYKAIETELADLVIRALDTANDLNIPLGRVVADKMAYNLTREDHKPENRKAKDGKTW